MIRWKIIFKDILLNTLNLFITETNIQIIIPRDNQILGANPTNPSNNLIPIKTFRKYPEKRTEALKISKKRKFQFQLHSHAIRNSIGANNDLVRRIVNKTDTCENQPELIRATNAPPRDRFIKRFARQFFAARNSAGEKYTGCENISPSLHTDRASQGQSTSRSQIMGTTLPAVVVPLRLKRIGPCEFLLKRMRLPNNRAQIITIHS